MENFHNLEVQKYWSFPASFKGDKAAETKYMIFSGDYIGSRKMDGAFYKFWKDENGNMELLGRSKSVSGDYLNKIGHVPHLHEFFESMPNGTCLIGELYFPNNEGSSNVTTIMGCLEQKARDRQEKGSKLHYYVFDVLAFAQSAWLNNNIEERVEQLNNIAKGWSSKYVEFANYYEGKELWNQLQQILAEGGEGIVITKKGTCYQPGKRPARQTLKVKKELQETIDVVVLGANAPTRVYTGKEIENWRLWENLQTNEKIEGLFYKDYSDGAPIEPVTKNYWHNWAGSLIIGVRKNDKLVPIGSLSGMTEEVLENWQNYKGAVAEITAMEVLETGGLRHPRFVKWRPDLRASDTDWNRIFKNE
jgi:ATP-dependent DNA ligase